MDERDLQAVVRSSSSHVHDVTLGVVEGERAGVGDGLARCQEVGRALDHAQGPQHRHLLLGVRAIGIGRLARRAAGDGVPCTRPRSGSTRGPDARTRARGCPRRTRHRSVTRGSQSRRVLRTVVVEAGRAERRRRHEGERDDRSERSASWWTTSREAWADPPSVRRVAIPILRVPPRRVGRVEVTAIVLRPSGRAPIVQRPRTLPFQGGNTGSNPVGGAQYSSPFTRSRGAVWSARRPVKPEVAGSNPVGTAIEMSKSWPIAWPALVRPGHTARTTRSGSSVGRATA